MVNIQERRMHPRAGLSFPLECSLIPTSKYFYTVCKDLSLGGAKVILDAFIRKGDSVKVDINLVDKLIRAKAKVAWCSQQRNADRFIAGLEFVEMNSVDRNLLNAMLSRLTA